MKLTDIALHEEQVNLWEMANLRPDFTRLPVTVWVSTGTSSKHGARIKVCRGAKWDQQKCSTIPLYGVSRIIGNADITQEEFSKIVQWIEINRDVLLQYWNGEIEYTQDLLGLLKPLEET